MSELDEEVRWLAENARHLGYDKHRVIERLVQRIARDRAYLERRRHRGIHTSHDEILTEDVVVTALMLVLMCFGAGGESQPLCVERGLYVGVSRFALPPLEEQVALVERHGLETLLYCPNAWALRHWFINQSTGQRIRARCNRWSCLYCGPRKVDQWRQLVKVAGPTLFLTLSKAGLTVEACARALTTFLQYLRRGAKGRGPQGLGAREAYPVEYFAVLERHTDFEHNGFHWHLLLKGVDYIPHEILKEGWRSATHGSSYIVHIQAIRKPQVIGYVTKYLMKSLSDEERGARVVEREQVVCVLDEQNKLKRVKRTQPIEVVSGARRIRYSRHFFPESVEDLRVRLFAGLDETAMEQGDLSDGERVAEEGHEKPAQRSSWILFEQQEPSDDLGAYKQWRRKALLEVLSQVRAGEHHLSRRVISMWAYQRDMRKG